MRQTRSQLSQVSLWSAELKRMKNFPFFGGVWSHSDLGKVESETRWSASFQLKNDKNLKKHKPILEEWQYIRNESLALCRDLVFGFNIPASANDLDGDELLTVKKSINQIVCDIQSLLVANLQRYFLISSLAKWLSEQFAFGLSLYSACFYCFVHSGRKSSHYHRKIHIVHVRNAEIVTQTFLKHFYKLFSRAGQQFVAIWDVCCWVPTISRPANSCEEFQKFSEFDLLLLWTFWGFAQTLLKFSQPFFPILVIVQIFWPCTNKFPFWNVFRYFQICKTAFK